MSMSQQQQHASKQSFSIAPREEYRSGKNYSQTRNQVLDPWIRDPLSIKRNGSPLEGDVPYPTKRLEKSKSRVSLDSVLPKTPKKSCLKQTSSKPKQERMVSFNSIVSYYETWSRFEYDRTNVPMSTIMWKDMLELRLMRFEATRQAFAEAGLVLPPTPPLPTLPMPAESSLDTIAEEMQSLSITNRENLQESVQIPVGKVIECPVESPQPAKLVNNPQQTTKPFTWNINASDFIMPQPQISYSAQLPDIIYQNQFYRYTSQQSPFFGDGPAYSYFIQPPTYGFTYQHGFGTPVSSPFVAV